MHLILSLLPGLAASWAGPAPAAPASHAVWAGFRGDGSSSTLAADLPQPISLAFVDVDLVSSASDCIRHIWPRLARSGIFFTHDVSYVKVLQSLMSESLWRDEFKEHPPILYGAGFGLGDAAAHIGFAIKGNNDANYIKAISLSK